MPTQPPEFRGLSTAVPGLTRDRAGRVSGVTGEFFDWLTSRLHAEKMAIVRAEVGFLWVTPPYSKPVAAETAALKLVRFAKKQTGISFSMFFTSFLRQVRVIAAGFSDYKPSDRTKYTGRPLEAFLSTHLAAIQGSKITIEEIVSSLPEYFRERFEGFGGEHKKGFDTRVCNGRRAIKEIFGLTPERRGSPRHRVFFYTNLGLAAAVRHEAAADSSPASGQSHSISNEKPIPFFIRSGS